jgi:uncharacterized membrane protein YhaH (DUF805 family)
MGFSDAVRSCLANYATFTGRAARSEYWYFLLFQVLANAVAAMVDRSTGTHLVGGLVELLLILPSLAVAVRRLHDIDKSGWWLLIGFVPVIGWLVFIYWACTKGLLGPNRFGPDPLPAPLGAAA